MKRIAFFLLAAILGISIFFFVVVYPREPQEVPPAPTATSTPATPTSSDVQVPTTPATTTPIKKPVEIPPPKPKPTPPPRAPQPPPPPAPTCKADTWVCTSWGACQPNNLQSRTCTMTVDCPNTETPSPSIRQVCAYNAPPPPPPPPTEPEPTPLPPPEPEPEPDSSVSASAIFSGINAEREKQGIPPLQKNSTLTAIAEERVDDMFEYQYFSHDSPSGKDPDSLAEKHGYAYWYFGENIVRGTYTSNQAIINTWMNSSGHRANILNGNYTETGVAVKKGMYNGREQWIGVQIFGQPR